MFSPRPTETKNRPSSRSRNGPISTSISWRNSVSASSRPAMKAPRAMERPSSLAARPAPMITSRLAAMNRSWPPARAAERNSGRSNSRPSARMATTPRQAVSTAVTGPGPPAPLPPSRDSPISTGATIRSWNSRMANTARPELACSRPRSAITGTTKAVDDMARADAAARAAGSPSPMAAAATAIIAPAPRVCSAPRPNTCLRISRSRSQDSSSPMLKSRNTTPSSAAGAISSGLATVR